MKPIVQSLHFNQQSWVNPVRALQRLRRDWELACGQLGVPQGAQCELSWEAPRLQARCSAALAARLRQITPDLTEKLSLAGWGAVEISWAVERSAGALQRAWGAQQAPWVNPNVAKLGARTLPTAAQIEALAALRARLVAQKRRQIIAAQRAKKPMP
jgi:hypothetical protein